MSYTFVLPCSCVVYVSCHPRTSLAHTRIIESRGSACANRRHETGVRLHLWELLPDPRHQTHAVFVSDGEQLTPM